MKRSERPLVDGGVDHGASGTDREHRVVTQAVRAGEADWADRDGAAPLQRASFFTFGDAVSGADVHEGRRPGHFYARMGGPTQAAFETAVAELEGGEAALGTASGISAIAIGLLSTLRPGDHVVAPKTLYATTRSLLTGLLADMGIRTTFVAPTAEAYAAGVEDATRLLYVETPANPTLDIVDLDAIAALARDRALTSLADNTFATPVNQNPLEHGFDLVAHSATKYLAGHGDVVAGVLVGATGAIERARWKINKDFGAVLGADNAWLALRGVRTLALRMRRHNESALRVARWLQSHPAVRHVNYPGLESHPGHDIARRQMRGFGGVVSFDVGDLERGRQVVDGLSFCKLAVSLGDVATLIQHSASMTHASWTPEQRREAGIREGLLRLSVGIERVEDIVADLDQALAGPA